MGRAAPVPRRAAGTAFPHPAAHGAGLGVWCGAVTPRGATVKVLASGPGLPVELELADGSSAPVRHSRATDADGVATFALTGLREGTRHRYRVSAPGQAALEGRFRTFADGPFSFRVLFASCAATGSTSPVFEAMREQEADLFVHMGDLHYEDIGRNEVARFRRAGRRRSRPTGASSPTTLSPTERTPRSTRRSGWAASSSS